MERGIFLVAALLCPEDLLRSQPMKFKSAMLLLFLSVPFLWASEPVDGSPVLRSGAVTRVDERFYENRVDLSYETASLFSVFNESNNYVFLPQIASVRWQLDEVGNEGWRRGNTEWIFSGYYDPVVEGPENYFSGALFGPRYNFVQEGWDFIPYIESRVGIGFTDSGTTMGAQGQDFMFTFAVGTGVRYVVNERLEISLGVLYQHFSNGGLSEPQRQNNGLDAIGPVVGVNWRF
ncbi:MAG: acyloxyacyl hydrolase [Blastochloris sp.]|nr:acyloxyacyl hydrolase [Blastochloris sp.]